MNSFDLSLLKYIQEHSPVLIEDVTSKFGKTLSTLKRYITTADKRIKDLSVALCLQDVVNKSEYYRTWLS
ncbi:hypothetical protein [Serratia fonticola]|uniref:hypothetical protein n=1 Tax=Serratia fonticola TaxID=47917 RepID=UPI0034C6C292